MRVSQAGVTLIEMVIVVAIIGILAALAYPGYQSYITKSTRAQGKHCVNDVQQRMEKFFVRNHRYATTIGALGYDVDANDGYRCPGASDAADARGYILSLATPTAPGCSSAICFRLVATPTGSQTEDGRLILISRRTTASADGRPDVDRVRVHGTDKVSW